MTFTTSDGYILHWNGEYWVDSFDPDLEDLTFDGDHDGPVDCFGERIPGTFTDPQRPSVDYDGQTLSSDSAPDLDRDALIAWLCWNDRNGCFTDADLTAEGFAPLTHAEALALVLDMLTD